MPVNAAVRQEPFRLLFPLGIFCGLLGVGHWLLYAAHLSPASSPWFHASVQVGGFMFCFISGFLMTALPRFASAPPASSAELTVVLAFLGGYLISLSLGWWVPAQFCFIGLLAFLVGFAGSRFARQRAGFAPPPEFAWIPIALLLGIIGSVFIVLGQLSLLPSWSLALGRPMVQQGFLLGIVLGVAGFMAPRLTGHQEVFLSLGSASPEKLLRAKKRRALIHEGVGILFFLTFIIEASGLMRAAYLLRASVVTANLAWSSRFYKLPKTREAYVLLVWHSLWFVCAGLWGAGLWPAHRVAMLHITFLGGFSLMIFAVGTMVALSHSAEGDLLHRPLWVLRVVGAGIMGAMLLRLGADLFPAAYFRLLGAASFIWVSIAVFWLGFAWPRLMKQADPEAFEQAHEAAKRRMQPAA